MNEFGSDPPPEFSSPPPPPSGPIDQEPAPGNPWEQRATLGFGGALIGAVRLFVTNPARAFEQTRRSGDYFSPLLFAILVGWVGTLLGHIGQFALQVSVLNALPPEFRDQMALYAMSSPAMLANNLVLTPFYLAVVLFIGSAIHHFSLMIVGALNESESGFEGTVRVNGYALVSQLAHIIPFVGVLITVVWFVALQVIGATRLHRTTSGRALVAALIPWGLCCGCLVLLFTIMGAAIMSSFQ